MRLNLKLIFISINKMINKNIEQLITKDTVDFNGLVKYNKITSVDFQSKMLDELKLNFTENEIQWYMANFYCFLHYHPTNDFPINLENIFKMIGFANKGNAKRTLENNFTIDEDYKIIYRKDQLLPTEKLNGSGLLYETIMINIDTFKSLCMIVKTDKAKEIRKYYIKLENTYNKMINQEYKEYKLLLEQREQQLLLKDTELSIQKYLVKSNTIIENFLNKSVVYAGVVKIENNYIIAKYGSTDFIRKTLERHKKSYGEQFYFVYAIESDHFRELERRIQSHTNLISRHIRLYEDQQRNELVRLDSQFTMDDLIKLIETLKIEIDKTPLELLLKQEDTKQKELDTKQKELETNKEIEIQKLKNESLKLQLELRKIELNKPEIQYNINIEEKPSSENTKQEELLQNKQTYDEQSQEPVNSSLSSSSKNILQQEEETIESEEELEEETEIESEEEEKRKEQIRLEKKRSYSREYMRKRRQDEKFKEKEAEKKKTDKYKEKEKERMREKREKIKQNPELYEEYKKKDCENHKKIYNKIKEENPEKMLKINQKKKENYEKMKEDPEKLEKHREKQRIYMRKRRQDEKFKEKEAEKKKTDKHREKQRIYMRKRRAEQKKEKETN